MAANPPEAMYRAGAWIDGRYRLLRCIGRGGMSWVWLAQHDALDIPVAIKLIRPLSAQTGQAWLAEARLIARLPHEAIVRVLDSGCTELGDPFLVMEHLQGETLAAALARDIRMPAPAAIQLLGSILDAVAYCHERGIVHRDIKPENIFLSRSEGKTHAKLLDFGTAKYAAAPCVRELAGTPGYMAPEQVEAADRIDARADIWALCAVLYEMIAGRPAIAGDDWRERLEATVRSATPPLWMHEPSTRTLWPVLERGLRRTPGERFATIAALRFALGRWLELEHEPNDPAQHEVPRSVVRPPRSRRQLQWIGM